MTTAEFNNGVQKEINAIVAKADAKYNSASQQIVYVVKGNYSGAYVDMNNLFTNDLEQAQAFANIKDVNDYIENSAYVSLLKPVKVNLGTFYDEDVETDLQEEAPNWFYFEGDSIRYRKGVR